MGLMRVIRRRRCLVGRISTGAMTRLLLRVVLILVRAVRGCLGLRSIITGLLVAGGCLRISAVGWGFGVVGVPARGVLVVAGGMVRCRRRSSMGRMRAGVRPVVTVVHRRRLVRLG